MKFGISLQIVLKINQMSSFMKIGSVGVQLFYWDGRADIYGEAVSRFSKFCEGA